MLEPSQAFSNFAHGSKILDLVRQTSRDLLNERKYCSSPLREKLKVFPKISRMYIRFSVTEKEKLTKISTARSLHIIFFKSLRTESLFILIWSLYSLDKRKINAPFLLCNICFCALGYDSLLYQYSTFVLCLQWQNFASLVC